MNNQPTTLPQQEPQQVLSNISWLKTLSIGFSLVSFGIAIGIGGYIFTTQKNQPAPQNQQIVPPTTQPSPTPDPTTSWKTYTNTKLGYTIQYPKDWENQGFTETTVVSEVRFSTPDMTAFVAVTVPVDQNQASKLYSRLKASEVGQKVDLPYGYKIKIEESTFNNYPAIIYSEYGTGPEAAFKVPKGVMFNKNGTVFNLSLAVVDEKDKKRKDIFDQILSTFKFTN